MTRLTATAAILAACLAAAAPAAAQPRVLAVSYADLDLTTDAGRAALDLRLVHAASEACGEPSPVDLAGRNAVGSCRRAVRAEAARRAELIVVLAERQAAARRLASR